MPDLSHMLTSYDAGLLKIIAAAWGIEVHEMDEKTLLRQVVEGMLDAAQNGEMLPVLPDAAREALEKLVAAGGRLPLPVFIRQSGEIRPMGAGRRDRERPDMNPASPAEMLWYAGLIGRAFLDDRPTPREFIFIPDDLMACYNLDKTVETRQFGHPAAPELVVRIRPTGDRILDDACTLLAALRIGLDPEKAPGFKAGIPIEMLKSLLSACGLLDQSAMPAPEAVRRFLEAPRAEALLFLFTHWKGSPSFDELLLLPHLSIEGKIQNDVLHTRQNILRFLNHCPAADWCDLTAFIQDIHDLEPDFQRPAGDYDSWFIRRKKDQEFLRGFSSWNEIEGSLLRFFITGPLHWLGILDLASAGDNSRVSAFRFSAWSRDLLAGLPPTDLAEQARPLRVQPDGMITIPRGCPRAVRYQIARASRWISASANDYRYQITPDALEKALGQGLKINYLLSILKRHNQGALPTNIIQAIERWEKKGPQARIKQVEIVAFENEKILEVLRSSPASSCLLETLSPTTAVIRPGAREKFQRTLLEMGYLTAGVDAGDKREENGGSN